MFFRTAWLVFRKDLKIEAKSWEVLTTTLFFAVSCVLIFAFAFVKEGRAVEDAAAGILWIAISFSGTLALGRTFERERYGETLRALLLAPIVALMFQAPLFGRPLLLVGLLAGGTLGFCAVGTLFAAMLVRARSRDVLLPILLYPIVIPVIIAGVRGTAALLATPPDEPTAIMWLGILAAFDTVFLTLALWTFEPLMTEE